MVWRDLGLNPGLPDHWRTLYPPCQFGMQFMQKYTRFSSWRQQISIQILQPLEKLKKSKEAQYSCSSDSSWEEQERLLIHSDKSSFKAEKWSVIKNIITGYENGFMTMFNVKSRRLTSINLCRLSQRQSFMNEKLCSMYDRVIAVLFLLSFLNYSQLLKADLYFQQLQFVHENLRKHFPIINRRNFVLLCDNNTKPYLAIITQEKILDLLYHPPYSPDLLYHPPYSPDLSPNDFDLFCSLENDLNDKQFSQEDQEKMFWKNVLSLKLAEFYLRGIIKQSDKEQEVSHDNGEYTINWN